ncbi:glycosyl hydrolase family 95 catalytic domain-containing protein [Cohnella endophytica]|uniref:glycosyl hydrolase family 95 catalytic domain-containing protein n=1 Tax=Cohnella endophytica TaxID=2419778 RepID=UPI0018F3E6AB|nr:carbohydrate-binding protein [Cohnella endophytica]
MRIEGKKLRRCCTSLLAAASLSATLLMAAGTASASTTSHSFNTGTGLLNVDYASYLSKHDIVFNSPTADPKSGITVGNGKVGAQMWNTAGGLTMQVSGVDASQEGFASQGLVNLYSNPGFDANYSTYQQRLSLYDGLVTTKYDNNRTVTVMGSPNSEVIGIHVDDSRTGLSSVSLDLSLWDVSGFGGGDVPDINTWRTVSAFADPTVAGFSRGQTDANKFGYTLAATVEGASFTTQTVNGSKVRLNITPTSSYTIWIACASRLNAPGNNSVNQAKSLLTSVKNVGYSSTLTSYRNWWHDFWGKSFVQYSNPSGDADYMENIYYLGNYMIAAGGYGNYPFHFINGAFSGVNDNDSTKWSNAYWYWNQRDIYNSFLASNHADMMNTFNNLYSRNFNALKSYTMTRYGIDGIWVPETMGWDGNARGTIDSDFVNDIMSTGTEAALNMFAQYKYTNDSSYLSNVAYPFMKEVAKFYTSKLSFNSGTGKYYMASSNSHETYWDVQNAITDLAAVRSLFPKAIQTSLALGLDSALRTQWQNVLNNLVAYPDDPADPNKYFPHTPPASQIRNGENVVLELLWPYDVSGIGASDYQKLVNNFNSRIFTYGAIWDPGAVQAARLGLGNAAYDGMKTMLQRYQTLPNGRTNDTNGEFEYLGVHLSAINESLLQSYNDKIRIFPAVPSDTAFNAKFTLLARGGFLVSSEKEGGEIKYAGIKSLYGNAAVVVNPWGTQQVQVRRASDNAIVLTSSNAEFTFNTAANGTYIVERTAKPLGSYTYSQLNGTANQGVKSLSGTNSKLGTAGGTIPPSGSMMVNDDAPTGFNYGVGWNNSVGRGLGDYNDDIHYATTNGATAEFTFTGTGIDYISEKYSDMGNVDVYIDNALQANVNLNVSGARQVQQTVYSKTGLVNGTHTIKIVSKSAQVAAIDAFRVYAGGGSGGTGAPIGQTISMKAMANNQYVCADNAGASALIANRTSVGPWEQFVVVDAGGGTVSLQAVANNKYVTAGASNLIADATSIGTGQKFVWVDNTDGTFSLRSSANNQYVCADNAGAAALIANRATIGIWEKFQR